MSMSMYVRAFRDLDGEFQKMMDVKNFCESKFVSLPKEVEEYFGKYALDPEDYVRDNMSEINIADTIESGVDESAIGNYIDVDVSLLPKEVKKLRFMVSF